MLAQVVRQLRLLFVVVVVAVVVVVESADYPDATPITLTNAGPHSKGRTISVGPINDSGVDSKENGKSKISKWLMLAPAIPTIFVFIFCVLGIAIKNHFDDKRSPALPNGMVIRDDTDGKRIRPIPKPIVKKENKKKKKKLEMRKNSYIYDQMVRKYTEDARRSKKTGMQGGRKSSQVVLEGMNLSGSPKSLARKHLLLGRLNKQGGDGDTEPTAVGELIKFSAPPLMGTSIGESLENIAETDLENDSVSATVKVQPRRNTGVYLASDAYNEDNLKRLSIVSNSSEPKSARNSLHGPPALKTKRVSTDELLGDSLLEYAVSKKLSTMRKGTFAEVSTDDSLGDRPDDDVIDVDSNEYEMEEVTDNAPLLRRQSKVDEIQTNQEIPAAKPAPSQEASLGVLKQYSLNSDASDCSEQFKRILEASRENLSEAIRILPDDVSEALLPEDLEEAFTSFNAWRESLL